MDEFAMGGSGETLTMDHQECLGPRKVPEWIFLVVQQLPASFRASPFVPLGSDTGGSIRQPAAFNWDCWSKPTYGTVSRFRSYCLR